MKKWLIGIGIGIALCVLAYLAIPKGNLHGDKQVQEVAYARQIGIYLFAHANDHQGIYPEQILPILSDSDRKIMKDYIESPRFHYHRPTQPHSELDPDYILITYDFPGQGKVVHTVGFDTAYRKLEK